ncbi:MAG: hypothetical protein OXB98_23250 [Bryobacterales bacterium]|nr:hypothetical protein [Bryobacterales bacterium]
MSVEPIIILTAVVAMGVALAGVILAGSRGLRQDMARLESRLDVRISALESRLFAEAVTGIAMQKLQEDMVRMRAGEAGAVERGSDR